MVLGLHSFASQHYRFFLLLEWCSGCCREALQFRMRVRQVNGFAGVSCGLRSGSARPQHDCLPLQTTPKQSWYASLTLGVVGRFQCFSVPLVWE
jgi:hypothetical protein